MKKPRPAALPSVTMQMRTPCGKIYVTVTVDADGPPFETFVRFEVTRQRWAAAA